MRVITASIDYYNVLCMSKNEVQVRPIINRTHRNLEYINIKIEEYREDIVMEFIGVNKFKSEILFIYPGKLLSQTIRLINNYSFKFNKFVTMKDFVDKYIELVQIP